MESNMVNEDTLFLYPDKCIDIVLNFFSRELSNFTLSKKGYYTGYWWVEYKNEKEDIVIYFDGDIGHHFSVEITIAHTKYSLWQFNMSVNQATLSTENNILYQLDILKQFLS
jgi:hypothetical protein